MLASFKTPRGVSTTLQVLCLPVCFCSFCHTPAMLVRNLPISGVVRLSVCHTLVMRKN